VHVYSPQRGDVGGVELMLQLHTIRTDTPNWDTKQRCTCGYESVSKCEQWKHAAEELRRAVVAILRDQYR
jgi:hypothetical protein